MIAPNLRARRRRLTLAGRDMSRLMRLVVLLQSTYEVTVVERRDVVTATEATARDGVECIVVELSHREAATEVRAMLERARGARVLFLAEALPLRPAVSRVIREGGHAVLLEQEAPVVVAATVSALLAGSE